LPYGGRDRWSWHHRTLGHAAKQKLPQSHRAFDDAEHWLDTGGALAIDALALLQGDLLANGDQ
jgi:hypothetical protein